MGLFGFKDIGDMFDGGGAGKSGSTFSTEGSVFDRSATFNEKGERENNYVDPDQNYNKDTGLSFADRFSNTNKNREQEQQNHIDQIVASNPNYHYENNMIVEKNDDGQITKVVRNYTTQPLTANEIGGDGGGSSSGGSGSTTSSENPLTPDKILEYAKKAGIVESNEEIEEMMNDPEAFLKARNMTVQDLITLVDPNAEGTVLDPNNPNYQLGDDPDMDVFTVDDVSTVDDVPDKPDDITYDVSTTADLLGTDATTVNAATGEVTDDMLVNLDELEIDVADIAAGNGALGNALDDYASIDISTMIDTSTVAGKLLADKLTKEGKSFVDAKASLLWQMETIAAEFKDGDGNPRIPAWAQGIAREVNRSIAFGDITGTAATAALSNAIMEATIGVADKESQFFQTLTVKNLDNKQEAIINKAKVLANMEIANLDARQVALVNNAKAFLEIDLKNLTNEQQAEVINTQSMVDALFKDQAAINAQRLFTAETRADFEKYYDELGVRVALHNSEQINLIKRFNAGEINDNTEFRATMEDSRQRFYSEMQYNIDKAVAEWKQTVEVQNKKMMYEALSEDIKNMLDITQEGQNQLWDRTDSLLDYIFKAVDNEAARDALILQAQIAASAKSGSSSSGFWNFAGQIGAALITSDERLKENIKFKGVVGGFNTYTWDWTEEAKRIGADKYPAYGVLAQELQKTNPEAVSRDKDGYLKVNYGIRK